MHPQQDQPRRLLGDRDLKPPERLVHIAERGMQRTDPPGRDDASAAGRSELGEDSPRLAGVARGRLEVREPERGAREVGVRAVLGRASGFSVAVIARRVASPAT